MCLPRPDSPSVFAAMLDRAAGSFRFGPTGVQVPAGRRYLPGTLVLETTWRTRTGWMIVRDALCIGPWYHNQRRSGTNRRPPTDYEAEHILLRTARCVVGDVEISLDCQPVFDYGRTAAKWEYAGQGYNEAIASGGEMDVPLRLVTDLRMGFEGPGAHASKTLRQGEKAYVAMVWPRSRHSTAQEYWAEHPAPATADEAFMRVERTADYWREWINRGEFPEHPWQSYLQRSALTLKGLTYSPTGALLAAPTTSLPETIGGERNWDYRYTWIRDGTFMLWGLYTLGFDREANDFFYFIADVAKGKKDLQIMYGIGGEPELTEKTLDHLSGYDGSRPVRVGNAAYQQVQHDVWGAVLDSVYLHTKSRDYLPEVVWPILKRAVECAIENWRKPDRGIWEVRGEPQHFTSSKLMCWVACDRGARLAELHGDLGLATSWQAVADEIKSDLCEQRRRQPGRLRAALRHEGPGCIGPAHPAGPLPAAGRPSRAGNGAGHRRRADRRRHGAALPHRPDRRRPLRRGRHVHDLLVLAGLGALRDRRAGPCARAVREAALLREPASAVRGRDRPAKRPAPGQLSAGVLPPGADQRGHARDRRRAGNADQVRQRSALTPTLAAIFVMRQNAEFCRQRPNPGATFSLRGWMKHLRAARGRGH